MKRHNDALAIQCGACNPSGIAHAIIEACREIRALPGYRGTEQICTDPAIQLMVHQLAWITGVATLYDGWDEAMDACKTAITVAAEAA